MFKIQINFDTELTKIYSCTLTDAFRHSANGPEFQLWPALSYSTVTIEENIDEIDRNRLSFIFFKKMSRIYQNLKCNEC